MKYEGQKFINETLSSTVVDAMVIERPLHIHINQEPFTVTLRMPGNEKELGIGLLYAEDIITDISLVTTNYTTEKDTDMIHVSVPIESLKEGYLNSRNFLSVSSCGICGKTQLPELEGRLTNNTTDFESENAISYERMFDEMKKNQPIFLQTGGCHAAAAFDNQGQLLSCKEDIGRHNAVDKVVGDLLLQNRLKEAHYLLVSGRVSYEIIVKTFRANIPVLAAVSAPSSLAIDYAKELGIRLIGFCRGNVYTVYA